MSRRRSRKRKRSRTRGTISGISRRTVLAALGTSVAGIGLLSSNDTHAFQLVDGDRSSGVDFAADPDANVGLDRSTKVKKNEREPLVYVENPLDVQQTVTITITNCADDILYNPADQQATCQITGTVDGGKTGRFDIEAQQTGTINFTIDANSIALKLNADRSVEAVSGNVQSAVQIKQFSGLATNTSNNEFTIDNVHVKDNDGDDDIDRAEFEVQDSTSSTVASAVKYCDWNNSGSDIDLVNCGGGKAYNPGGNPNVTIQADEPINPNETYQATVDGYDADGNFDTDTVTTNE